MTQLVHTEWTISLKVNNKLLLISLLVEFPVNAALNKLFCSHMMEEKVVILLLLVIGVIFGWVLSSVINLYLTSLSMHSKDTEGSRLHKIK